MDDKHILNAVQEHRSDRGWSIVLTIITLITTTYMIGGIWFILK